MLCQAQYSEPLEGAGAVYFWMPAVSHILSAVAGAVFRASTGGGVAFAASDVVCAVAGAVFRACGVGASTPLGTLISHNISYTHTRPTHQSSRTTHLTYTLISHHSSLTTHLTPLISHQSSHTTHLAPLISHHSFHTTHLTPLISHHSSHTNHLSPITSPSISYHPFINNHHLSYTKLILSCRHKNFTCGVIWSFYCAFLGLTTSTV